MCDFRLHFTQDGVLLKPRIYENSMYPDKLIFVRLFQLVDNDRINFFDVGLRDYGTAGLVKTKLVVWTASFLAVTQSDDGTTGLQDYKTTRLRDLGLIPHSTFSIPHSAFLIQHSAFHIPHSAFRIPHSALK